MPRPRDPDRFSQIVSAAIDVFIDKGYRSTQMSDIAEAMGIAKGTLYLYVESKEALFDLALRAARGELAQPDQLPVPTPPPASTLEYVRTGFARDVQMPRLEAALQSTEAVDVREELTGIVSELYQLIYDNRVALKLVDRSSLDYPELAAIFFDTARQMIPQLLYQYLKSRLPLERRSDSALTAMARGIVEVTAFWAMHRHWDPAPTKVDEADSERVAVLFSLGVLDR
ncbi:MAG: helix-turn-helix domain-containing protein [Myxococcota bacterium]